MTRRLGHRCIALIAAYALALNVLLAPLAMAASAMASVWPDICGSAEHPQSRAGDKQPMGHQSCPMGACSLAGCGALVASDGVRRVEAAFSAGRGKHIEMPRWRDRAVRPHSSTPHLARAPPAA
jgi:hypothetical protein